MLGSFCWDPDGIGHPGAIGNHPLAIGEWVPVSGLRHSTGGEVVIKRKLIETEGDPTVGSRGEGSSNTDPRAIDGLSVL